MQNIIQTLKLKGKSLLEICTFNLNNVKRSSRTWNNFNFKLEEFIQWLDYATQEKLHQNNCVGNNIEEANLFLKESKSLLSTVQVKMYELEGMKGALKVMLNEDPNTFNKNSDTSDELILKVQEKIRSLSCTLEERITISSKYVKFLKLANDLKKEMQILEKEFSVTKSGIISEDTAQQFETRRLTIQQLHLQVCNASKNCIQDINGNNEACILKQPIIGNINQILSNLNKAQNILIEMWTTISSQVRVSQEITSTNRIVENLVKQVKDVEQKICPLMNTDQDPTNIVESLEASYTTLSKAKALVCGLEQLAQDIKIQEENKDLFSKTDELSTILQVCSGIF